MKDAELIKLIPEDALANIQEIKDLLKRNEALDPYRRLKGDINGTLVPNPFAEANSDFDAHF